MIASKDWGACFCNCGKNINRGDEFVVIGGGMYLRGHEGRATREIPIIAGNEPQPGGSQPSKSADVSDLPLFSSD
jgi:hypothetical protein